MSSEKKWTEEEADELMRRDEIENWSYDKNGAVVVKRKMTETVTDPDWKGQE